MSSVNSLKGKIKSLESSNKDNKRVQMINGLKAKNRDVELVVDVLKQELKNKEMEEDDINDLIVKKTIGGPLRFRPQTREQLLQTVTNLEKRNENAKKQIMALRQAAVSKQANRPVRSQSASRRRDDENSKLSDTTADSSPKVVLLLSEIEELKVQVGAKELNLATYAQELDQLETENRTLRECQSKLASKDKKYASLKKEIQRTEDEVLTLTREAEEEKEKRRQAEQELEFLKNTMRLGEEKATGERVKQLSQVKKYQEDTQELARKLEENERKTALHKTELRQENYEIRERFEKHGEEATSTHRELQSALAKAEAEKTDLSKNLEEHTQLKQTIQEHNGDLQRQVEELTKRNHELQESILEEKNNALAVSLRASREHEETKEGHRRQSVDLVSSQKSMLDSLRTELEQKEITLEHQRQTQVQSQAELEAKMKEHERAKEEAEALRRALQREKTQAQAQAQAQIRGDPSPSQTPSFQESAPSRGSSDANGKLEEYKTAVGKLQKQISALKMMSRTDKKQISKQEDDIQVLQAKLESGDGGGGVSSSTSRVLDDLQVKLHDAEMEVESLEKQNSGLQKQLQEIEDHTHEVDATLVQMRSKHEKDMGRLKTSNLSGKDLDKAVDKSVYQAYAATEKKLRAKSADAQLRIRNLTDQIDNVEVQLGRWKNHVGLLETKLSDAGVPPPKRPAVA